MKAFTYIPPRQTSPEPILSGVTDILKTYNEMNARRRKEQSQRINTIMELANELDYVNTISQANKIEQMNIRDEMTNQIVDIVKKGRSRDGGLSDMDVFKAMNIIKDAGQKIGSISQYEKKYFDVMDAYYKEPGKYRSETFSAFNQLYMTQGGEEAFKLNPLRERPIYFDQWKSEVEKGKKYHTVDTDLTGTELSLRKSAYLNENENERVKERVNEYVGAVMTDTRKMEGLKESFVRWGMENRVEYANIMNMNNGDASRAIDQFGQNENKAALMYGIKYQSPRLAPDYTEKQYKPPKTTGTADKKSQIEGIRMQDGSYRWIIGGKGLGFSGNVTTKGGQDVTLNNAKIDDVVYDPVNPDESIIKFVGTKTTQVPARYAKDPKTGEVLEYKGGNIQENVTYEVPYNEVSSFIKNNFNLIGLDKVEQFKPTRKKISW